MADDKFDSIVVGAGPAGVSAAITMAKAGLNVALLERGEYAGAKIGSRSNVIFRGIRAARPRRSARPT